MVEDSDRMMYEAKFTRSVGMSVKNCVDNTGDKNLSIMTVKGIGVRVKKIIVTRFDVMCACFMKKGKLVLRKKVMSVVVICQRKSTHRKEGILIYFEDNAGVIVNVKGEMKGSAITRPVSQVHFGEVWRQVIVKANKREVQNDVTDGRWSMVNTLNDARTSDS